MLTINFHVVMVLLYLFGLNLSQEARFAFDKVMCRKKQKAQIDHTKYFKNNVSTKIYKSDN